MVVAGPAVEFGPARRFERGVGDFQRPRAGIDNGRGRLGGARNGAGHVMVARVIGAIDVAVIAPRIGVLQRERRHGEDRQARLKEWLSAAPPCATPPFGSEYRASVATSFQLGSREVTSRAKVHTSVTLVTRSALPSMTSPLRSRVAETSCDTKRSVICAVLPRNSAPVIWDTSIETKRVSAVSPRAFALADHLVEAVIDLAPEEIAQRPPVALGIGGDDHLVGGPRPGDEMLGVEALVDGRDGVEAARDRRARRRNAGIPVPGVLGDPGRLAAARWYAGGRGITLSLAALRTGSGAE